MKIGIFADIHGNIYAFKKVWESLQAEQCDVHCFLGDICGYYYHQNEAIDILRDIKNIICVRGNHDNLFLKMIDDFTLEKEYTAKYGKASSLLKHNITEKNLRFIRELPDHGFIASCNIGIFHGNPWDYMDGYIYPDSPVDRFEDLAFDCVLMGHTHYPMKRLVSNKLLVNPGSCGQPRDCNLASYALLDTQTKNVEIIRVSYDVNKAINDVKINKENNPYLSTVLMRGGNA